MNDTPKPRKLREPKDELRRKLAIAEARVAYLETPIWWRVLRRLSAPFRTDAFPDPAPEPKPRRKRTNGARVVTGVGFNEDPMFTVKPCRDIQPVSALAAYADAASVGKGGVTVESNHIESAEHSGRFELASTDTDPGADTSVGKDTQ